MIHPMPIGGGFGRRIDQRFVQYAAQMSRQLRRPVSVLWGPEDDLASGAFGASSTHCVSATLRSDGRIGSWQHHIAGCGIIESGAETPYTADSILVTARYMDCGLSTGSLRSTSHAPNAFARECAIDEVAFDAGQDPALFRLQHLDDNSRLAGALRILLEKGGWRKAKAGRGLGVAIHQCKGSYVAQMAEVSLDTLRGLVVHRIVCAADIGFCINPMSAAAQLEGGILFGLSNALKGELRFTGGRPTRSAAGYFPVARMNESPQIEVHILDSREAPGGVGEIAVPPVAAAIANAVFHSTGSRLRTLPLSFAAVKQ
jgi:isoquinoline 1-oxidoreductase beta subunit